MDRCFEERGLSFLVISSPKSGSQWVSAMCRAHPDIECAESRLFGDHLEQGALGVRLTLDAYVGLLRQYHRSPGGDAYYDALLHDMIDTIADTSKRVLGVRLYGEKITPYVGTSGRVVERILEYDPTLPVVHLVRDGRDVVVSGQAHHRIVTARRGEEIASRLDAAVRDRVVLDESFDLFLRNWVDVNRACRELEDRLVVRYEDLLTDPIGELHRILTHVGASTDAAPACVEQTTFERMSGGRSRGVEDLGSVVRKGVAGDWVHWLSDDQNVRFLDAAGDVLAEYGYPAEPVRHAPIGHLES